MWTESTVTVPEDGAWLRRGSRCPQRSATPWIGALRAVGWNHVGGNVSHGLRATLLGIAGVCCRGSGRLTVAADYGGFLRCSGGIFRDGLVCGRGGPNSLLARNCRVG